ncbi:MAG: HAMP domain-containing sensor histidine kinase [Hyphomicrobiaceae bacterium]|nr:HAMP domain-containing sensor histidine kinase [Hyphomicrobiaceae bacterium]
MEQPVGKPVQRTVASLLRNGVSRAAGKMPEFGLSKKLLVLTLLFVMLAEVLIFVPSVANFRINWLMDRLMAAQLASLAAEATPSGDVPERLKAELLRTAQVKAVAMKRNDQRQLILQPEKPVAIDQVYDLAQLRQGGLGERLGAIADALAVLVSRQERMLRIVGQPGNEAGELIEIVLPEAPLRHAMWAFALNILWLSIIISVITAALVYMALNALLVRPMMRVARNMVRFAENPEDRTRIIVPSDRHDEIGQAERELAHMQTELAQLLSQKSRLAALGLAVSKINHDLRNLLANTQLLSDRLTSSPDPTVQRFAPKLIASLDRAIAFCNDTLTFGRAAERPPVRKRFRLATLVTEVGDGLDLPREGGVGWQVDIPATLELAADQEHVFRVLNNLVRNAVQALEGHSGVANPRVHVSAARTSSGVRITVADNGPGVPPKARERMFQAFQGSVRKGGTGLGLAIAYELIAAHGGTLRLLETTPGATFEIVIPDAEDG